MPHTRETDFDADYVIVGAGSAGCVLAARLSEDSNVSVLLIESGGTDRNPLIHVPLGIMRLMHHRILNWRFNSVPQSHAANRSIYVPRGNVIGGSSSINGMVYMRGHPLDYDDWASDCPGWSFGDVLPYFNRSEHNEDFDGQAADLIRGRPPPPAVPLRPAASR